MTKKRKTLLNFVRQYLIFFSCLQLVVVFAIVPLLLINHLYGDKAAIIYTLTSSLILSAFGVWLWFKGSRPEYKAQIGALSFGIVFGFLMAEIVTVTLMIT